jgi:hypothetical protein
LKKLHRINALPHVRTDIERGRLPDDFGFCGGLLMGAGGSRFGAGRPGWHVKAEYCRRIDVRRWQREYMLRPGAFGSWVWRDTETGETTASIAYTFEADAVVLRFAIDGQSMSQRLDILRTPCTYGGSRPWFACPRCRCRVAVLFLRGNGFACRHCQRIAYRSQSEDDCGRAWIKQSKIEAKLADDWERPKGMHHRTYERLLSAILECEDRRETALAAFMAQRGSLLL